MKRAPNAKSHMWTLEEIRLIKSVWDNKSVNDIAEQIGVLPQQIQYIATQMRKEGIKLPRKHVVGRTRGLIQEYARSLK